MLLSREALPAFDLGGLGLSSASAVLVSMNVEAPLSGEPQGPPWNANRAAADPEGFVVLQDETGGGWSGFAEDGSEGLIEQDDGMPPADSDSAEELLYYLTLDDIPAIPWTPDHTVEGSLDAARAQIAYRIPVGPKTGTLRLSLRPTRDGSEVSPIIDRLFLVDPTGRVLSQVATAPIEIGNGGFGQHLLVTLLDAPEGSEVVIHLAIGGVQSPALPGGGGESSGGGFEGEPPTSFPEQTDFSLNIQRSDPAPTATPEEPSPGFTFPAPLGTTPPPLIHGAGGSGSFQTLSLVLDGLIRVERGWGAGAGRPSGARSAVEPDSPAGSGAQSVYLGPLVSRGAAPLGPTLATSTDDPAPLIDRENHAVDEAIDQLKGELDSGLLASMKRLGSANLERIATTGDHAEASMAAIPGPRGLPVVVSHTGRSHPRAEAGALTAHLQSRSVEEALTAEVPGSSLMADPVAAEVDVAHTGIATRAAGLLVGLGLATSPLYPDLIALARKKFARAKRPAFKRRWPFRV